MGIKYAFESGAVAAGAVITSPTHRSADLDEVTFFVDNIDGAATDRTLTITFYAEDGTTVLFTVAVTCTKGGRYAVVVSSRASPVATPPAGVSLVPFAPTPNIAATLAAAGTKAASLSVYGR